MSEDGSVVLNGKVVYLIRFPVGDESGDGHERCDYFIVISQKPVSEIRNAHFRAPDVLGFDIGEICSEYGDYHLEQMVVDKLRETGFDFSLLDEGNDEEIGIYGGDELILIWLHFLNHLDSDLQLKLLPSVSVMFGKRLLEVPGYGLFGG